VFKFSIESEDVDGLIRKIVAAAQPYINQTSPAVDQSPVEAAPTPEKKPRNKRTAPAPQDPPVNPEETPAFLKRDEAPAPEAEKPTPELTQNDIMAALNAALEKHGLATVQAKAAEALKKFKTAQGAECKKRTELQPKDTPAFLKIVQSW